MATDKPKIGWIGLGTMGQPMAMQLIKAGYEVSVYNRNSEREKPLVDAGASPAATPKEMLSATDVVFLMVTDDTATRNIFNMKDGLSGSLTKGKTIINMSTVSPDVNREFAAICVEKGAVLIDAPVSGSLKQAQEASLVILVGGGTPEFDSAKQILQHLGKAVMHLGPVGAGNAAKLAINLLLSIHALGLSEAVLFAENNGISQQDFFSIFNNGALSNAFGKVKSQAILDNNYKPAFSLRNIAKDLRLANDKGLETPLAKATVETFQKAATEFGEEDIIAVVKFLKK